MFSFRQILSDTFSKTADAIYGITPASSIQNASRPVFDLQYSGCFELANKLGKNPNDVANELVSKIELPWFVDHWTIGSGFINIKISDAALETVMNIVATDDRFGINVTPDPKTIIIDYGGPNVAKSLHVGHLRSSVIGDTLRNMFLFNGDKVIGDAHLGDWGLQMGLLIVALREEQPSLIYFDSFYDDYFSNGGETVEPVSMADLERLYPLATQKAKSDAGFKLQAKIATSELQNGQPRYLALWKCFVKVSLKSIQRDYEALGVKFDVWKGESDSKDTIPVLVQTLKDQNLLIDSEGAKVVPVEELPPIIIQSQDGTSLYGTTDLATIIDREKENPDYILYCVDERQSEHFKQVFSVAKQAGLTKAKLEHIANGTVNDQTGKPLKTRNGGTYKLSDLIFDALQEARLILNDRDDVEEYAVGHISNIISRGAIRYSELSNLRTTSYVFDIKKFGFDGKTAPYISYQAVRMKKIMNTNEGGKLVITNPLERDVCLLIESIPFVFENALKTRMPSTIANHVYDLAVASSKFYSNCDILTEKDLDVKRSRITLVKLIHDAITLLMKLLGIDIPERM